MKNGQWNEQTMDNDITILKLKSPLTLGGSIQAACLPSESFNPAAGSGCFVSGWGALQSGITQRLAPLETIYTFDLYLFV